MKLHSILSLFVLSLGFLACAQGQAEELETLSTTEFRNAIQSENILLVDVRTPDEFKAGKIAEAVNWNYYDQDFMGKFEKVDKDKPIYLYCRSGGRSGQAGEKLINAGYTNVHHLGGGILAWEKDKQ